MLLFEAKAQGPDPASTNGQSVKALQDPVASVDLPSLSNPQNATSPSHPEHPFEVKHSFETENEIPISPESSADPQVPDDNGLLDGIEEPMKIHKISMDSGSGNKNFVEGFIEEKVVSILSLMVRTSKKQYQFIVILRLDIVS